MSFSVDVSNYARKKKASVGEAVRVIKIKLFSAVIMDTPVRTGRLRGNWQTNTGRPIASAIDRLDPSGDLAISDVRNTVTADDVDYISNNLPYAQVQDDRYSMIAKNVTRIMQIVRGTKS